MANKINIVITAEDKASKPIRDVSKSTDELSGSTERYHASISKFAKFALVTGVAAFTALSGGATAAAKASFDQVNAVENARFGLQAYEKDASKVNLVLSDLVSFAKSDTGVLFNRKDLFAAASTLKMYGDATQDITGHVKTLSKGVAQGKTTFQELSSIVGRAAAKGRLDAVDFDMLIERGIGLDKSFRGAKVTSEELWKALDKAIPDETLAGRADTIDGKMIRLQSSFRGVGDQILGVDSKTSNFIKGGLGDRFMSAVSGATSLMKDMAPTVGRVTVNFLDLADRGFAIVAPEARKLGSVFMNDLLPALKRLLSSDIVRWAGVVLVGAFKVLSTTVSIAMQALAGLFNFISDYGPLIGSVALGYVAYRAAVLAANGVQTAHMALLAATGTRYVMINGVLTAVKTATIAQTIAQKGLNLVMSMNPIGLVASAIVGLTAGIWLLTQSTDSNTFSTTRLNDARRKQAELADQAKQAEQELQDAQRNAERDALAVERAQRSYNDAVNQYGEESLEAREAALGLEEAYGRAKSSTEELTRKTDDQLISLQRINGELTQLNGRSIEYTVNGHRVAEWEQDGQRFFGGAFASGTNSAPGGSALVGEHGPERVQLPRGAQVTPAYQTRQQDARGGSTVIIENYNSYNERDDNRFFRDLGFALELAS